MSLVKIIQAFHHVGKGVVQRNISQRQFGFRRQVLVVALLLEQLSPFRFLFQHHLVLSQHLRQPDVAQFLDVRLVRPRGACTVSQHVQPVVGSVHLQSHASGDAAEHRSHTHHHRHKVFLPHFQCRLPVAHGESLFRQQSEVEQFVFLHNVADGLLHLLVVGVVVFQRVKHRSQSLRHLSHR